MTTHARDSEAKTLLDLCDKFASPEAWTEDCLESRLLALYKQHSTYTVAVDGLVEPLTNMDH
jgi:hypothetical protein